MKLQYYVGGEEFEEAKKKILEVPRKALEKEMLKSTYIEDNPYNLSFIYRFNILADNSYFPDKNFEVYEHEYKIDGKYPVFDEQKKQFIKLMNMGRLNVMLENEDYWPNEDQIASAEKLRKQFKYLGPIITKDHVGISETNCFSLSKLLLTDELQFISEKSETPIQSVFHRYICLLSAHAYIKNHLTSNKLKL